MQLVVRNWSFFFFFFFGRCSQCTAPFGVRAAACERTRTRNSWRFCRVSAAGTLLAVASLSGNAFARTSSRVVPLFCLTRGLAATGRVYTRPDSFSLPLSHLLSSLFYFLFYAKASDLLFSPILFVNARTGCLPPVVCSFAFHFRSFPALIIQLRN